MTDITKELFELQDEEYKKFHTKLIPTVEQEKIIGIRTPKLRVYAKELVKKEEEGAKRFLEDLPHTYYEENNLHAALLNLFYKKPEEYLEKLEIFLPYVDNWATCDMISPKVFKKNLPLVYEKVKEWLKSDATYTVRFGIVTLLGYFLDDAFEEEMLSLAAGIESEEYYIKMAVAWYFSIALIKQYDAAIGYFETPVLETWTHNKALQKAVESLRISEKTKTYLRSLKRKNR